jgi:hypothetical protein
VLEGGDDAGALQPPDVGGAEHRDEVRVLAHRLLDATPAVVAHDVEDRRKTLVHADGGQVPPDRGGHPLDEVGVERRAPRDRRRVDRRAERREPGQALLVDESGDAQPGRRDDDALLADQFGRAVGDGHRRAAVDPGEVAQPVPARLLQRRGAGGREDVLHRRDVGGCVGGAGGPHVVADPAAAELGGLLLDRHLREEQVDPGVGGKRRILPRGVRCLHSASRPSGQSKVSETFEIFATIFDKSAAAAQHRIP